MTANVPDLIADPGGCRLPIVYDNDPRYAAGSLAADAETWAHDRAEDAKWERDHGGTDADSDRAADAWERTRDEAWWG